MFEVMRGSIDLFKHPCGKINATVALAGSGPVHQRSSTREVSHARRSANVHLDWTGSLRLVTRGRPDADEAVDVHKTARRLPGL